MASVIHRACRRLASLASRSGIAAPSGSDTSAARWLSASLLLALLGVAAAASEPAPDRTALREAAAATFAQRLEPLLARYCIECHDGDTRKGGLDLARLHDGEAALDERATWAAVAPRVALAEMPPAKSRQPTADERAALVAWIRSLPRLDPPDPGTTPIRRLAGQEYRNTLRDLFVGAKPPAFDWPDERIGAGFGAAIPPLLMEKLLLAADAVLDNAIVADRLDRHWPARALEAVIGGAAQQAVEVAPDDDAPRVLAPGDELRATVAPARADACTLRVHAGCDGPREPARVSVRVDGEAVGELVVAARAKAPAWATCRVKLPAGRCRVALVVTAPTAPAATSEAAGGAKPRRAAAGPLPVVASAAATPVGPRTVAIDAVELTGPPAERPTDAQRRIIVATPGKDVPAREAARRVAESFAGRAFRRPATPAEIDRLLAVFALADAQGETFSESVKLMLKATLVSPAFLFRNAEDTPRADEGPGAVALDGYGIASRLSYFLWSTMPDDELMAAARDGGLRECADVARQARRLLRDARSHELIDHFFVPWLALDDVLTRPVDAQRFPEASKTLRQAMLDEPVLVIDALLKDGGPLTDLIDGRWTFLNQQLAAHYGIGGVDGPRMRRVELSDERRGGLMTMAGVLFATSMPNRTSPVKRGKWVLEHLVGMAPAPPPANVAALDDQAAGGGTTLRERTERHRADQQCARCHRTMDPIGFGLEGFDALGRVRARDDLGAAVDARGELPGGAAFADPAQLKRIIAARRDDFTRTLAAELLGYALGRALSDADRAVVDDIAAAVAADGYRLDTLVIEVATCAPFRYRRPR